MDDQRGQGVDIVHLHYVKAGVRGGGGARLAGLGWFVLLRGDYAGWHDLAASFVTLAGLDNAHYPNRRVERLPCPQSRKVSF